MLQGLQKGAANAPGVAPTPGHMERRRGFRFKEIDGHQLATREQMVDPMTREKAASQTRTLRINLLLQVGNPQGRLILEDTNGQGWQVRG